MDGELPFDVLLRRATNPPGLERLLAALGARGVWRPLELDGTAATASLCVDAGGISRTVIIRLEDELREPVIETWCRAAQRMDPTSVCLVAVAGRTYARLALATYGLDGRFRHVVLEPRAGRRADAEILEELAAEPGASTLGIALRHARVLDRAAVTRAFFKDFRGLRERVAAGWTGIPNESHAERAQLALLFLCRLMFLYFLQRQGRLGGRADYLISAVRENAAASRPLYEAFLRPLFFAVLNTRPERRTPAARALGDLPYLNGGLFEAHALERRHPDLALADEIVHNAFEDVLESYRFSRDEQGGDDASGAGVSPEMMGRVFENLMAAERRSATGTYYTPRRLVERVVRESVSAYISGPSAAVSETSGARGSRDLRDVRVLDPACGSGAFLAGALEELARLRAKTGTECVHAARRDLVTRGLYGVDVQEDAALLCALRLWLALAPHEESESAAPLPNLDRSVRQGNALIDPLEIAALRAGGRGAIAALDPAVRRAAREIEALSDEYARAEPGSRARLRKRLAARERQLARAWLQRAAAELATRAAEQRSIAASRDLFGEATEDARAAADRLNEIEAEQQRVAAAITALTDFGALPYFSFPVHFAGAAARGFDLVFCNPPWLRAHRWAGSTAAVVRAGYEVCRDPGWRGRASCTPRGSARQVDLSLLFLERSLRLLAPGGVLGIVLPAKVLRSLYAGGARRLILRYAEIISIEDHSLDQRSVFRADSFTCVLILRRRAALQPGAPGASDVPVTMIHRNSPALRFTAALSHLPFDPADGASPWMLVPAEVAAALRKLQSGGSALGDDPKLRIRRGIASGANDVFVLTSATPRLGGLTCIEAAGARRTMRSGGPARVASRFRAHVESAYVSRLLRGCDVTAWRYRSERSILCAPPDATSVLPPRVAAYLRSHGNALPRADLLGRDLASPKVVWHDLASSLKAVAVPRAHQRVIPLNTVYFVTTRSDSEAYILAALFNSLPMNTFARALAERAKDAHFRFFAWLVALLPLPPAWRQDRTLLRISHRAHAAGGLGAAAAEKLDAHVARAFDLNPQDCAALRGFDAWLRGVTS